MTLTPLPAQRTVRVGVALLASSLLATACSDDGGGVGGQAAAVERTTTTSGESAVSSTTAAAPDAIDPERCAANEAAGTITYLSGFDFAAASSILDVVVAEQRGYFDELCLDVELKPSLSTANYPLIAAGRAQFSSAGNYTEILNFSRDGAEFVAVVNYGKAPIEALITPEGGATSLEELRGMTIGVKGDLPPSIVALLARNGLERGEDYEEVLLDGYDPRAHLEQDIDALPVYKSNEPGQLDEAGIDYTLFDPAEEDIPGSFGLIYTSKSFAEEHPTAVEDFVRAALKGMEDAIADPTSAVALSLELIDAAGNENFLTLEGETYRWQSELEVILASTPAGEPVGLIHGERFREQYDAYVDAGVWPDGPPEFGEFFDDAVVAGLYGDDGKVIWPTST